MVKHQDVTLTEIRRLYPAVSDLLADLGVETVAGMKEAIGILRQLDQIAKLSLDVAISNHALQLFNATPDLNAGVDPLALETGG